ncbi:hypothetical protein LLE49_23580 [Alicyclobacillus tolerans]|uniref:hypothetical protein n=1 Tax=Alicyclobacillus tolerans TaxID=90970 RepID=UPI001F36C7A2|nr:hypothetical protein [Alicyclobacillus tolerans]MCF8567705.1 hypothetical protein [Alicyclobacillus tolerans]
MTDGQTPTLTTVSRVDVANSVLRMLSLCKVCATRHVAAFYAHTNRPSIRAWEVLHYLRERDYVESYRTGMNKEAMYRLSRRIRKQYGIIPVRWNSSTIEHRLAITDVYVDLEEPETFVTEYRSEYEWRGRRHVLSPDVYTEVTNGKFRSSEKGVGLNDELSSNEGANSTRTLANPSTLSGLSNRLETPNFATSRNSNHATSHGLQTMFIEVQRTPIESKRWAEKRMQYEAYFSSGMWQQEFETKPVVVVVMSQPQMLETIGTPIGYDMYVGQRISNTKSISHLRVTDLWE